MNIKVAAFTVSEKSSNTVYPNEELNVAISIEALKSNYGIELHLVKGTCSYPKYYTISVLDYFGHHKTFIFGYKVSKKAKIGNRYNQVRHPTQVYNTQKR